MERTFYSWDECQDIATNHNLGKVHWQERIAQNSGKPFEVGYVYVNNCKELFCKKQSFQEKFYLCNDFSELK